MNFLVLGASGQTGSYLAQTLELDPKNRVFSASRSKNPFFEPSNYISLDFDFNQKNLADLITNVDADAVINLISLSSVFLCEQSPDESKRLNFDFVVNLSKAILEAQESLSKAIHIFQCSSSEMYSNLGAYSVISESTDLNPGSVYGIHKANALEHLREFRAANPSFAYSTGILFNHESPRRSLNFVSKKIVSAAREISFGRLDKLELGDISVERDWSYAPDFAEAIASIVSSRISGEYVFASGELHSIREFCELSFKEYGISDFENSIRTNPSFLRKNNNNGLIGNPAKLRREIAWTPKVGFAELVRIMCRD